MTFEIFYAGEVSTQQIFYSDPKNYISPLGKYDKFIQQIDALAQEIKQLKEEARDTEEEIESGKWYSWDESAYQADNTKGWVLNE